MKVQRQIFPDHLSVHMTWKEEFLWIPREKVWPWLPSRRQPDGSSWHPLLLWSQSWAFIPWFVHSSFPCRLVPAQICVLQIRSSATTNVFLQIKYSSSPLQTHSCIWSFRFRSCWCWQSCLHSFWTTRIWSSRDFSVHVYSCHVLLHWFPILWSSVLCLQQTVWSTVFWWNWESCPQDITSLETLPAQRS